MKAETPYIHLHERKRTWTPVQVSAGTLLEGGEDVIKRALALRCLEIPVGDFISDAMKGDLPEVKGCKELLLSNVKDEENMTLLNFAAASHRVSDRHETEAQKICKAWLELIVTRSLKPWFWRDPSSSFSYQSFDSLETPDYAPLQPTSAETSRRTYVPTHSYAKRLDFKLTRPSTILGVLRSHGLSNPYKGKVITNISPATSGLKVQILSLPEGKQKD